MSKYMVLGLPGAGKTTHAHRLADDYDLQYLDARKIMRSHQRKQAGDTSEIPAGVCRRNIREMNVYTSTITDAAYHAMVTDEMDGDVVLEGYPSTVKQAKQMNKKSNHGIDAVIYLHVEDTTDLITRMEERGDRSDMIKGRLKADKKRIPNLRHFYYKEPTTDLIYIDAAPGREEDTIYQDIVDSL